MSESDDTEIFYYEVQLSIVHAEMTKLRATPLSEAEKENIFRSLFVAPADYEQYVIRLQQKDEQDRKDSEVCEVARLARLESDPVYWKRLYQGMVEREEEFQRTRDMWIGALIVCGAAAAILYGLRLLHVI